MKQKSRQTTSLAVPVIRGTVLGVSVYRGFARLCDLARISKADVYDQVNNPTGTQRDLNPKHAREAYEYVTTHDLAFWPEVFLCVRKPDVISFSGRTDTPNIGTLHIDLGLIEANKEIAISRVDGNHRLHYAEGADENFKPIEKEVSFCLAYDLSLEKEITLFRDINDNQRRMNTSHLDNIETRLTPSEQLKLREPEIYIAQKLGEDKESPLFERVYQGGKKSPGRDIPLRALSSGINYMLIRPTKLRALRDADAQYKVIRNYFWAVKKWQPSAWVEPRNYLVLRGAGLWAICLIGAEVIDKVLGKGSFTIDAMHEVLTSGKNWDWSNKGDFQGYSGAGGAQKISDSVTSDFQDDSGVSVKKLFHQIMTD